MTTILYLTALVLLYIYIYIYIYIYKLYTRQMFVIGLFDKKKVCHRSNFNKFKEHS